MAGVGLEYGGEEDIVKLGGVLLPGQVIKATLAHRKVREEDKDIDYL